MNLELAPWFSQLSETFTQLIKPLDTGCNQIILGYSGGADSELCAFFLSQYCLAYPQYRHRILLVHVHHGLSENADNWAEHCRKRAAYYQLNFKLCQVQLRLDTGESVEAQARKERYQAFAQLMQPEDLLLTGHHQDDQLETLLLALKRGQGPKGLAAMGMVQRFTQISTVQGWHIRPLLNINRVDIEQIAAAQQLPYITDESNFDTRYDRNFLRQKIIPLLKERWSSIAATASRSAMLCAQQQQLLDEVTEERLVPLCQPCEFTGRLILNVTKLSAQSSRWQAQLLRHFIGLMELPLPSQIQLAQALKQLLTARNDAVIKLVYQGLELRRYNGFIYAHPALSNETKLPVQITLTQLSALSLNESITTPSLSPWQEATLKITNTGVRIDLNWLRAQFKSATTLELRWGINGSVTCQPHNRDRRRAFKKLWQEFQIPPWLRQRIPILLINEQPVALANCFVIRDALATGAALGVTFCLK